MNREATFGKTNRGAYPSDLVRLGSLTDFLSRQCPVEHYSGYRPTGAPALDRQTMERASRHILAGLCFYHLLQDIEYAPYPQTHGEREDAFRRARETCKRTAAVISAKSEQLRQRKIMLRLEAAAKTADEATFLDTLKEVEWRERSASDYTRIIDLALEAGAHVAARKLSMQGADAYPDNAELRKYARVLAPPRVVANRAPRNINVSANVEWLNANKDNYRGKWVAVKDGELMGAADSRNELITQIGETKGRGILVTRLY